MPTYRLVSYFTPSLTSYQENFVQVISRVFNPRPTFWTSLCQNLSFSVIIWKVLPKASLVAADPENLCLLKTSLQIGLLPQVINILPFWIITTRSRNRVLKLKKDLETDPKVGFFKLSKLIKLDKTSPNLD